MWLFFFFIWNKNKKKLNTLKFSRDDAQKPFFSYQIFLALHSVSQSVSQSVLYAIFVCNIYVYISYYFFFFITFSSFIDDLHIDCECKNSLSYRYFQAHTCTPKHKYMLAHTYMCPYHTNIKISIYLHCVDGKITSKIPNWKGKNDANPQYISFSLPHTLPLYPSLTNI